MNQECIETLLINFPWKFHGISIFSCIQCDDKSFSQLIQILNYWINASY